MYNYRLGGNSGTIPITGGWRKKLHDKDYDLNLMTKEDLLFCKILADIEKELQLVSYTPNDRAGIDLRVYCTPVEYQYIYYTCAAFAVVGGIEVMNKRWFTFNQYSRVLDLRKRILSLSKRKGDEWLKKIVEDFKLTEQPSARDQFTQTIIAKTPNSDLILSSLFAYKLADNSFQTSGPFIPFSLEVMIDVIQKYGVCTEKYWPYIPAYANPGLFYENPPVFCYKIAENNNTRQIRVLGLDENDPILANTEKEQPVLYGDEMIKYYDMRDKVGKILPYTSKSSAGVSSDEKRPILDRVKELLYDYHIPVVGAFYLYPSTFSSFLSNYTGFMPFPKRGELAENGHCVLFVGYDDNIEVPSITPGQKTSKGALLFKNSWSEDWGNNGYGWLSYEYFATDGKEAEAMACDCWAIYSPYPELSNNNSIILRGIEDYVFSQKQVNKKK